MLHTVALAMTLSLPVVALLSSLCIHVGWSPSVGVVQTAWLLCFVALAVAAHRVQRESVYGSCSDFGFDT